MHNQYAIFTPRLMEETVYKNTRKADFVQCTMSTSTGLKNFFLVIEPKNSKIIEKLQD